MKKRITGQSITFSIPVVHGAGKKNLKQNLTQYCVILLLKEKNSEMHFYLNTGLRICKPANIACSSGVEMYG